MSLEDKKDIVHQLLQGKTSRLVSHLHGVCGHTICTIMKAETLLRASIASCTLMSLKIFFVCLDTRIEKMEIMLNLWIEDRRIVKQL